MTRLLRWDLPSFFFVASIVVFGSCMVFLAALDLSSKGKIIFIILGIASFFSSLSLILQIKEKRKRENNHP
jgi:hypothetical protein